jgi:hypothetical protein
MQTLRDELNREMILASGLFDPDWYQAFYAHVTDSGLDPATHFLNIGGKENCNSSPLFDATFFVTKHTQVRKTGVNPLIYYLASGLVEGLSIRSLERHGECQLVGGSEFFDEAWYVLGYGCSMRSGVDPVEDFLDAPPAEFRDPGPRFSTEYYVTVNSGLVPTAMNPFLHYIKHGSARGLKIAPVDWQHQRQAILRSGLFDAPWYLQKNPDVAEAGQNALDHFMRFGGGEGRAPGPLFDSQLYLSQNPDVAAHGLNPLLHYVHYGSAEKRPIHYLAEAVDCGQSTSQQ